MFGANLSIVPAPVHWGEQCVHDENRLHQLSPYIGKLKSRIAADLISTYTHRGDLVVDPFCGSGTIPLECALAGRRVVAADANSYAVLLTRAKLNPPRSLVDGLEAVDRTMALARARSVDLRQVPAWVRRFFHPRTLRESIAFADACMDAGEDFLLACLLGILHHQRPGFLSYPSSHLVPYLRDQKYPPTHYPEMYEYRDLESRLKAKLSRALKQVPLVSRAHQQHAVQHTAIERLSLRYPVDAVITSPPYMNALDYRRDNRLRLWFLERDTANYFPEPTDHRRSFERMTTALIERVLVALKPGGTCIFVVGETVRRKRMTSHPASHLASAVGALGKEYRLIRVLEDQIPDVRRSRREYRATKKELILVFKKLGRRRNIPTRATVPAAPA